MAEVHFTAHLRKVAPGSLFLVDGATVGEALESACAHLPPIYAVRSANIRRH
jgi:molybdopterin converting factor small subunit